MAENPKQKDMLQVAGWAVGAAVVALSVVITAYIIRFSPEGISPRQDHWGLFGDYVGGIMNPIIAFLALIVLFIAVKLQKEELEAARTTLKQSARTMQEQSEVLKIQAFESTFFKLVEHNFTLIQSFDGCLTSTTRGPEGTEKKVLSARESLVTILRWLNDKVTPPLNLAATKGVISPEEQFTILIAAPEKDEKFRISQQIRPYVDHLLFSIRFLKHHDIDPGRRKLYEGFLRCSVEPRERALTLYCLLFNFQSDKESLREAVEFGLFDGMGKFPTDHSDLAQVARLLVTGVLSPHPPSPAAAPTALATPAA